MKANQIRQSFFEFFKNKQHKIVNSAPIVLKDDPTLMFTNAGMNQFKDLFLGYKTPTERRLANSQKCLRVSGKHNDLEEVGRDSYHHTMFEMLGNWSIGDYFKEDTIDWAWELLTKVYKLDPERIYATVFEGDHSDGLGEDAEAAKYWEKHLPKERILYCSKKDNFWEMGETGPCGPCSELHYDIRSNEERAKVPGEMLVNKDSPEVIEIWNLVFIQFNRKANGKLEDLPEKHIDTGMGFERLCMAMQGKNSNYETDVFSPFIKQVEEITGIGYTNKYDNSSMTDIAMRVAVDHIRAVSFAIADGELPSNTGAGYVIRRILRRSVRYNYSFLNQEEPMLYKLVKPLAKQFKGTFPELEAQKDFVEKVIKEEEKSFLNTLNGGLKRFESINIVDNLIDGKDAFELYDTYGFPIDLTRLIAAEKGYIIDEEGFQQALNEQKERGRKDAKRITGDWNKLHEDNSVNFVGYDELEVHGAKVISFREVKQKDKTIYQIVLDKTPFYAEGGGQVGDQGVLIFSEEQINVFDTKKENDLIIHYTTKLPKDINTSVTARVNSVKRHLIENNHSATHLLHAALRQVLGNHVQQKGSLVRDSNLRFDFSHFQKISDDEIKEIEKIVNHRIRENIKLDEQRSLPLQDARDAGAMMLFGEKYGDYVRMITFDPSFSRELCGGCHVNYTGKIGFFKIVSESAVAAGVRRIEAVTSLKAESFINDKLDELDSVLNQLKSTQNPAKQIADLIEENKLLHKEIEKYKLSEVKNLKSGLLAKAKNIEGIKAIISKIDNVDAKNAKTLAYNLLQDLGEGVVVLGLANNGKPQVMVAIDEALTKSTSLHAGNMVKNLSAFIKGGGGGQPFYATAGGSYLEGLEDALLNAESIIKELA